MANRSSKRHDRGKGREAVPPEPRAQGGAREDEAGTRDYWLSVLTTVQRSWPGLAETKVVDITKDQCRKWATDYRQERSLRDGRLRKMKGRLSSGISPAQGCEPVATKERSPGGISGRFPGAEPGSRRRAPREIQMKRIILSSYPCRDGSLILSVMLNPNQM